jgi:CheY-like chemotaxis protein
MNKPILLIEDDENDVLFARIAMGKAGIDTSLQVVNDGREALGYLNGEGKFSDRNKFPLPCLALLDLRLPRIPGFEVLKSIRNKPELQGLPVIMLTSSNLNVDVEKAYELGADSYVVKPNNVIELFAIFKQIKHYWLNGNRPAPDCKEWESVSVAPPCHHQNLVQ